MQFYSKIDFEQFKIEHDYSSLKLSDTKILDQQNFFYSTFQFLQGIASIKSSLIKRGKKTQSIVNFKVIKEKLFNYNLQKFICKINLFINVTLH